MKIAHTSCFWNNLNQVKWLLQWMMTFNSYSYGNKEKVCFSDKSVFFLSTLVTSAIYVLVVRLCMCILKKYTLHSCSRLTALCDKVCQWFKTGRWLSLDTPISSTNQTDRRDITETLLKVTLNTITPTVTLSILLSSFKQYPCVL